MSVNCGIVGLPNVGKSTIFQALTSAPAEAANYPFCTIEPNQGIVTVADKRMDQIAQIISPQKIIPTIVEFVDIAGLVKGASKGEGLGNQFLGHIRQVNAIVHVVRCFEDEDITHVHGTIDPVGDIETINLELALADLEVVERKLSNMSKFLKSQDKKVQAQAKAAIPVLERLQEELSEGRSARSLGLDEDEKETVKDINLITLKDMLYACNIDENTIGEDNDHVKAVRAYAEKENSRVITVCGKLEAEIAALESDEDKAEFRESAGLEESGLDQMIKEAYQLLGLRTYFTAGEKEVRAWTFKAGAKAPEAAGVIHTDFEKGFIKAEIYHCDDLFEHQSEQAVKTAGKLRMEGKEYVVQDGDVIHFRFNV